MGKSNPYAPGVSVVLCGYNSAPRLPETLAHLAAQVAPGTDWELVVVDNASTDGTAKQAADSWAQWGSPAPLQVVTEPEPGLSAARRRGVATARYEYILFCDDDNWLAPNYLQLAVRLMGELPTVGILGGQCQAIFEAPEPPWFKAHEDNYSVGKQWGHSGTINRRGFVWGAGMVARHSLLDLLHDQGFASVLSDRKGKTLASGGDNEICLATLWTGQDLYFDERLQFKHLMTRGRLTWPYLRRLYRGFGWSHWPLDFYWYVEQRQRRPSFMPPHIYWRDTLKTLLQDLLRVPASDYWHFLFGRSAHEGVLALELKLGKLQALLTSRPVYQAQIAQIEHFYHRLNQQKVAS
jgi:glycosyltransferase involved in cell wall biosynthesis